MARPPTGGIRRVVKFADLSFSFADSGPGNCRTPRLTFGVVEEIVRQLAAMDPAVMSQAERVDALTALERLGSWVAARQVRVVAAMADDPLPDSPAPDLDREWVKEDLRAALGESREAAHARLELAKDLVHRLRDTLDAVEAGRITFRQARALSETVTPLDDVDAHSVESAALEFAQTRRDLASFRRKLAREVAKTDPRSMEEQFRDHLAERRVRTSVDSPGMSSFWALLPATGCAALLAAIELRADLANPDDCRSRDQRRADALVQIAHDTLTGTCPTCNRDSAGRVGAGRLHPVVQVTVPCPRCWASTNSPASWTGTARSPPPWPGTWPPTAPARGGGWSPTSSGIWSTTAAPRTVPRPTWNGTLSPGIRPAGSRPVTGEPAPANSTTSFRGSPADLPMNRTWPRSAAGIITASTTPAGS